MRPFRTRMARFMRYAFATALSGAVSCSVQHAEGPVIAEMVPDIAALASLRELALGDQVEAVERARPSAVRSPYVGLSEAFGRDTVLFRFPTSAGDDGSRQGEPTSNAKLAALEFRRHVSSDSSGRSEWLSLVAKSAARLGAADCYKRPGSIEPSELAKWAVSGVEVAVILTPRWQAGSHVTGSVTYGPTISVLIAEDLRLAAPHLASVEAMPCPANH